MSLSDLADGIARRIDLRPPSWSQEGDILVERNHAGPGVEGYTEVPHPEAPVENLSAIQSVATTAFRRTILTFVVMLFGSIAFLSGIALAFWQVTIWLAVAAGTVLVGALVAIGIIWALSGIQMKELGVGQDQA